MSSTQMFNSIQVLRSNGITVDNSHLTKPVHELHYVWMIEQYSSIHGKKTLYTPTFSGPTNSALKWYLELEPGTEAEDEIGLFLYLDESSEQEKAWYKELKFSIIDNKFKKQNSHLAEYGEIISDRGWGFANFISKNDLLNKKLLLDDKLTIYCELTFSEIEGFTKSAKKSISNSVQLPVVRPEYCISKNFYALFENQKLTDVTLSVKGKEYRVHKAVLAARSPVFSAMFEHNMKENQNNLVEITDIEEKVVEEMLHYIYTDECKNLKDLATGLLVASNKYDLMGLKIMCQEFFVNNLTTENAAEMLCLADLHAAFELKSQTIRFIAGNSIEVMNSVSWKKCGPLYPPSLMMEVCEAISRQAVDSFN